MEVASPKKPATPHFTVMEEVLCERACQNDQWGGGEHDDTHSELDWFRYIFYQMNKLMNAYKDAGDFRQRMIKIAALAIAAVESYDRKHPPQQQ